MDLTLKDGSKIAIIGGGPAGAFFAHFAYKLALAKGIDISVVIFDGKDFLQTGPKGCNLCAGVIAESLNQKLKNEGIYLPEKRIINRIDGYCLHVENESLLLSCIENENNSIATVFRGNGPRYSTFPENISFDDFLLSLAQDNGAEVISHPVWGIESKYDKHGPITLQYGKKDVPQEYEADLVVGAFGVNTYLLKKFQEMDFGYKPPQTLITFQAELKLGQEEILNHFGNNIHVWMPRSKKIRYATVTPKRDFITITLIGRKDAKKEIFQEFFDLEEIKKYIPLSEPLCFCYPKIVISPSKNPFTDRLVLIGDSSYSRHYKNGIESAFITAQIAAETSFFRGIDALSFASFYKRKAKKKIVYDNYYGRFLFFLNDMISSVPPLRKSHLSLAKRKGSNKSSRKIRSILWNMFTGNIPYRNIFKILLDLRLQITLLLNTMRFLFKKKPS